MRAKRYLYLAHRWLGIVLCLFMALWFFSGVVMMYVGYPKLTAQEHLQALPVLDASSCCVPVPFVLAGLPTGSIPRSLRLTSIGGDPAYVIGFGSNRFIAIDGRSGKPLPEINERFALKSATAFMPGEAVYAGPVMEDAWTHSRALDGHRPLHRVEILGDGGSLLYISASTGEVVRDATRTERVWNWVGAWLHWLYPLRGGGLDAWWSNIVIYTSLAATLLGLTGLWVGLLRWRRKPYANASHSPYRSAWARWHHWFGLVFGALLVTWIASGLFSMNPWKIFDSGAVRPTIGGLVLSTPGMPPKDALACLQDGGFLAAELEWTELGGEGFILARQAGGDSRLLPQSGRCAPFVAHEMASLQAAGAVMLPASRIERAVVQNEYDEYYYGRAAHTMAGHLARPLPLLRLEFDDAVNTWLYLDPRSGALIQRLDSYGRVKRWLFSLLHSWDWLPLLTHRPWWDVLLVLGSLGGFLISISAVVLGWRRLCRSP